MASANTISCGHRTVELDNLISNIPSARFIASPVFGAPAAAVAAQLLIVMSGDYRSKKEVAHILYPAVGRKVVDLGGNVEKGSLHKTMRMFHWTDSTLAPTFKLIGNAMILGSLELIAEVYTLSEKAGIGAASVHQFIKDIMPAPPSVSSLSHLLNGVIIITLPFQVNQLRRQNVARQVRWQQGLCDRWRPERFATHSPPRDRVGRAHAGLGTSAALPIFTHVLTERRL